MMGLCLYEKYLGEKRSQGSSLERAVQDAVDLMDRVVRGDAWQQGVWGWWTEVGDHMEKRELQEKMRQENPDSLTRGGGMETITERVASEQGAMPRS